jgi:hypothetical protein
MIKLLKYWFTPDWAMAAGVYSGITIPTLTGFGLFTWQFWTLFAIPLFLTDKASREYHAKKKHNEN